MAQGAGLPAPANMYSFYKTVRLTEVYFHLLCTRTVASNDNLTWHNIASFIFVYFMFLFLSHLTVSIKSRILGKTRKQVFRSNAHFIIPNRYRIRIIRPTSPVPQTSPKAIRSARSPKLAESPHSTKVLRPRAASHFSLSG